MFVMAGPRYTADATRAAIAASLSWAEALRRLGMRAAGGNSTTLRKYADLWGISTDHFDHRGRRGSPQRARRVPLEEVMGEHSTYNRGRLKQRLYETGLKTRSCELCGQGEMWRDRRISLILDHVNGVFNDNRLENLRIVCPNCAAALETHCGAKLRREERSCIRCGAMFWPTWGKQRYCGPYCGQRYHRDAGGRPATRKVDRPPYHRLLRELKEGSFLAVGRTYGVSDNAVRKWLRQYERDAAVDAELPAGSHEQA